MDNFRTNGIINTMFKLGDVIYVGGSFTDVGLINPITAYNIAMYDTTTNTWTAMTDGSAFNGLDSTVNAIFALDSSNVYIGGQFTFTFNLSGIATTDRHHYITRWNGTTFNALTDNSGFNGLNSDVNAIHGYDATNIFIGGQFTFTANLSGTSTTNRHARITRWNGSAFNALTDNLSFNGLSSSVNTIYALDVSNVYIGGEFIFTSNLSGIATSNRHHRITRWNGTQFNALINGTTNGVNQSHPLYRDI